MVLGSEQGVTDLCKSTDSALIARQIAMAQGIVEDELGAAGLTTPTTSTTLSLAVNLLAAALVGLKPGEVDPRTGYSVEGFSRNDGNTPQIDEWEKRGMLRIATYIKINKETVPVPRSTTS
jgi:hypothetical protein